MQLVRLASVSANPNKNQKRALADTRALIVKLFSDAGITDIQEVSLPPKSGSLSESNKIVYGRWDKAGPNRPTVLLYAHYDVARADDAPWHEPTGDADPFVPVEYERRLYGRGAADDKSGIIMHLSAVRAFNRQFPVNLIIVLEGEEEIGTGSLDHYIQAHPEKFQADVIVIADTGNLEIGKPTLTSSLRGLVNVDITINTLKGNIHSGLFGGPALDSFMVLVRMLNTLVDWRGDTAVAGLTRYTSDQWPPSSVDEENIFRAQAGVLDNVQLAGSGSITQRVAGSPAINIVGLDGMPTLDGSVNQLHSSVTARISVRTAPNQNSNDVYQALRAHLLNAAPFGVVPEITKVSEGDGYHIADGGGPYYATALRAAADAYPDFHGPVLQSGLGGTIPTIKVLAEAQKSNRATVVMWGCEEPSCHIHGSVESVSYDELTRMTRAEVNLLQYLASGRTERPAAVWRAPDE